MALDAKVSLADRYDAHEGAALMSGMQALVRLVLEQAELDRENGLHTGGYISGYRGSPIGTFDLELMRNEKRLQEHDVVFNPGLNEDLAATAVSGTQTLTHYDQTDYDGVTAYWYGKGPGVDRSIDAIKHAQLMGSSKNGGIVWLMGDDPSSKSSTVAHQSDQSMIAAMAPILFPSSIHEYVETGLHAVAMSRFCGTGVALKIVTDTADSTATVDTGQLRPEFVTPEPFVSTIDLYSSAQFVPFVEQERRQHERLRAALHYARANRLNRALTEPAKKRLGIISVGKTSTDVRAALRLLGLDSAKAKALGIGHYAMKMVWPVEPVGLMDFVRGYDEILVVEEKRPIVETELARLMVNEADMPVLLGKQDAEGNPLLPSYGEMSARLVAQAMARSGNPCDLAPPELRGGVEPASGGNAPVLNRVPYYCAGCPHNRSTKLPDGSMAGGGIGCHAMAVLAVSPETTQYFTQMGGEGMHWVGRSPFVKTDHMFQNLGDGTYAHSGLLAIKAAVAAGTNITYKILYNDAVAMTGGQPVEGQPLPADIATEVLAAGARRVVVTTDEVEATRETGFWPTRNVSFHHRDELDLLQRQLRKEEGVTVLLNVQVCAAEKRRRRKRGILEEPPKRVIINPAVCEGCGDCGLKSNCVAIKPLDTPMGLKRTIEQNVCNKDYSCLDGFCPSFVTVETDGEEPLKRASTGAMATPDMADLPDAPLAKVDDYGAVITGIGGTGVVTVAAVLAMAARLEGLHALSLDQTGLSQKNGAVSTHLQIASHPLDDRPSRLAAGSAHALLAFDMLTGAGDVALSLVDPEKGVAIANGRVEPLAIFAKNPDARPDSDALHTRLVAYLDENRVGVADTSTMSRSLAGDGMGTNFMLVGVASQMGALPVSPEAIEQALTMNGTAVDMNIAAFRWGRWWAHDRVMTEAKAGNVMSEPEQAEDIDSMMARLQDHLVAYQNAAFAKKFENQIAPLIEAERALGLDADLPVSKAAAKALHKHMAVKDEYEVARLHSHADFTGWLKRDFVEGIKLKFYLAPPLTAKLDPVTGEPRKKAYGGWMQNLFGVLAGMKSLRGTMFDVFGYTAERKWERQLTKDVTKLVYDAAQTLDRTSAAIWLDKFDKLLEIKGFGHVKRRNYDRIWPQIMSKS